MKWRGEGMGCVWLLGSVVSQSEHEKKDQSRKVGTIRQCYFLNKMCTDDLKQPNLDLDMSLNFKQL